MAAYDLLLDFYKVNANICRNEVSSAASSFRENRGSHDLKQLSQNQFAAFSESFTKLSQLLTKEGDASR